MISSVVSRACACYLFLMGIVMLFASDSLLPAMIPGFPPNSAWIGQLIAAGWLSLAAMNWQNRGMVLGGIYGRPVVYSNVLLYVVSALGVFRAALAPGASPILWGIVAPSAIFAIVYGALLLRGPFDASFPAKQ